MPIFEFYVPPALASPFLAGLAQSNYGSLGTQPTLLPEKRQTFIYTDTTPDYNAVFGHGAVLEHEVGHHLGFNHPFHGYRCLTETCGVGEFIPFGGSGLGWFSRAGNYSSGMMTYVNVNNDYSRFELDNLQRWLTWQYLDLSNFVVGEIARSPHASSVSGALVQADARAGAALTAYRQYDYDGAEQLARAAYDGVVAAAAAINVKLAPEAYQAVRRNPMDFNQALRDYVSSNIADTPDAMSGRISTEGVHGLEGRTVAPPTTRLVDTLAEPAVSPHW